MHNIPHVATDISRLTAGHVGGQVISDPDFNLYL